MKKIAIQAFVFLFFILLSSELFAQSGVDKPYEEFGTEVSPAQVDKEELVDVDSMMLPGAMLKQKKNIEEQELVDAIYFRIAYYKHNIKKAKKYNNDKMVQVYKKNLKINRRMLKQRTTFLERLFHKKEDYQFDITTL